MNSLNILLSYSYIYNLFPITWGDILFGIHEGFWDFKAAVEHSYNIIEKEENSSQRVLDMAFLHGNVSIYPLIDELVEEENKYDEKHAKEKYLYAVLKWVYKNQSTFLEPLEAVECIYADFGYPEIISKFVRYASNNEPDLGSRELNIKRIYNNWEKYLETEKIKWKKEMNIKF